MVEIYTTFETKASKPSKASEPSKAGKRKKTSIKVTIITYDASDSTEQVQVDCMGDIVFSAVRNGSGASNLWIGKPALDSED